MMPAKLRVSPRRPRLWLSGVCLFAAIASAGVVFTSKKAAEDDARAIAELNREIAGERQRISELKAEWSALDHPARLQRLVARHNEILGLEAIRSEQITTLEALPDVVAAARARETMESEE